MRILIFVLLLVCLSPCSYAEEESENIGDEASTAIIGDEPLLHKILEVTPDGYRLVLSTVDLSYAAYGTRLPQRTQRYLDSVIRILAEDSANIQSIEVSGHSDSSGNAKRNYQLCRERAKGVAQLLKKGGFASRQIKRRVAGSNEPIADNGSKEGRRQNRRVEILIKTSPEKIDGIALKLAAFDQKFSVAKLQ